MEYRITQSRLLYVLTINDRKHEGLLKIGEVFVDNNVADSPNVQELAKAVREELDKRSYMGGVKYNIDYVECTTYDQSTKCYKADDVYRTLAKMGVASKALNTIDGEPADIWFAAEPFDPLSSVKEAIEKIKSGHSAGYGAIKFRPEQDLAITETVKHFNKPKGKAFLWNAKMRFGKTLSGLEVAKQMDYKSTLIITHRPVVDKGWHDDFKKIFETPEARAASPLTPVYATRMSDEDATGGDFYQLTKDVDAGKKKLVFFVSMQYLRLSQFVGGKERHLDPLKKAIMQYDWDFVMVDEAHEGIEAAAGVRVMEKLKKENTRILSLSGTPFNLLDKYEEGEIYTWDYVMEQKAKQEWDDKHFGDPNPYADLPRMQILTFTLPKMVRDETIQNNEIFKFHEFFRVWTEADRQALQKLFDNETNVIRKAELKSQLDGVKIDRFVHEDAVRSFVTKLHTTSNTSQYPFSTDEFRDKFRHTFWILPGVKEAAALEQVLRQDRVFGNPNMFHIINAAGDGNIEDKDGSALADVLDNIRGNQKKNITAKKRTITLSCGKLTTGVSVAEWTAVLCMKGSENTPAANYMQTIFRVQTHATLNGRQKSDCYVFDFAPDRALTAVAETAKMAVYAQTEKGKGRLKLDQKKEEEHLAAFIKLCPVLSMDEGEMGKHFSANQIFEKLSNVYIERAVRSGYADNSLYNPEQLMNLTPEQEKALGDVHDLLGSLPASWKPEKININNQGIGTGDGDQVKYIYYLSSKEESPKAPSMSDEYDVNNCPQTEDAGWDNIMNAPTKIFPYLFVSSSRHIDGGWTSFSKPVLWKQWIDKEANTDEAKKKRDEENKEKRARMSVLRGVSIRIPLLVYGAEINDDAGEEITIDNFTDEGLVDNASWEEFMPKGFTKETFNILKDCFDRAIFTGAAKRIRQMVKEADNLSTEDRINKIATIFSYFHNPDKETVLTPWRIVNMHMSDCLGGWCFFNEEFDANYTVENEFGENINAARYVDRGQVTKDVFADYNSRILEINSKTGLYPLYMAYSIFKGAKEPAWRQHELTGERGKSRDAEQYYHQAGNDSVIWKEVLQENIFVICRTKMAVSITKRTLAGFRNDIRMNVKCYEHKIEVSDLIAAGVIKVNDDSVTVIDSIPYYNNQKALECDMINVLKIKPDFFQTQIVQGKTYWSVNQNIQLSKNEDINNMKFSAVVGNPPYQQNIDERSEQPPVYNYFFDSAICISKKVSFISPARFLFNAGKTPTDWNIKMLSDKHFKVIKYFSSSKDVFPTVDIKGGVAITFRNEDENYGAIGEFIPNDNLRNLVDTVKPTIGLDSIMISNTSYKYSDVFFQEHPEYLERVSGGSARYLSSNVFEKFPEEFHFMIPSDGCQYAKIIGRKDNKREVFYFKEKYLSVPDSYSKFKVFIPGNNGSGEFGEVISGPFVAEPMFGATETFVSFGCFDSQEEAENLLKYLKTKFCRAMLSSKKVTQHAKNSKFWQNVPMQDFSKSSDINWSKPIQDIDEQLFKKYGVTEEDKAFVIKNVQTML